MRKLLPAIICCLSLCGVAHAQVAVFDASSKFEQLQQIKNQLSGYLQDLKAYVQYVQTAQQALVIAEGLVHNPTNFGAYLALGNMAGINLQSTLPIDPYSLMALTSGYSGRGIGGLMGKLNTLGNLTNTNVDLNSINRCSVGTFACQLQTQRQYAAAGQEAAAQQVASDMNNHLTALAVLKARCLASPDAKDSSDCGNQIAIETAAINADTAQLQATQAMANAQQSVFTNRASEWIKDGNAVARGATPALPPGG